MTNIREAVFSFHLNLLRVLKLIKPNERKYIEMMFALRQKIIISINKAQVQNEENILSLKNAQVLNDGDDMLLEIAQYDKLVLNEKVFKKMLEQF